MLRHFRVLDMQGEGLGYLLQRERNGHDPPTDGDEEAAPTGGYWNFRND